MDLKHYRLIKTIVEEGNIASSSEKLFLTQSALSHQLREIEEKLGFKIFNRSRNRWQLTEHGEELYHLSNTLFQQITESFKNLKAINEGTGGLVRIGTECYSFYQGLPENKKKVGLLYPTIKTELVLEATHHPLQGLLSKEIDIAIVTVKKEHSELVYTPLHNDEIFALMHRENKLHNSNFLYAEDFIDQHLIIHSFPLETVSVYQQFLNKNGVTPQKISAIPLTEVALEMVAANMGITCLPKWALKSFQIPKDILIKKIGKKGFKRQHYIASRKKDKSKKFISNFIINFTDEFLRS